MVNVLINGAIVLASLLFSWLVAGLIPLNWDVTEWTMGGRVAYLLVSGVIIILSIAYRLDDNND